MDSKPVAKLILGDGIILLRIIILDGFTDGVMHEIIGSVENTEDSLISKISPMCMFVYSLGIITQ